MNSRPKHIRKVLFLPLGGNFACTDSKPPVDTCTNEVLYFEQASIETIGRNRYSPYHNEGPSVAAFDVDQDGQMEVLQCFQDEALLQYDHEGYHKISHACGAMAVLDWNQDGWLDLVMEVQANEFRRRTKLWWFKNTNGTLLRSHETVFGLNQIHNMRVVDLDQDGLDDLYLAVLAENENQSDHNAILWGKDNFATPDFSLQESHNQRKTFDAVIADFNQDGWMDVMDANDRGSTFGGNVLWWNHEGVLEPEEDCHCIPIQNSMGIDAGDVDRDGWVDTLSGDVEQTKLLINENGTQFVDVSLAWGAGQLKEHEMSWGVRLVDINNDGALDIFSALGDHTYPGLEQPEYEGPLSLSTLIQTPDGFVEKNEALGFTPEGSFRSILPIHWNDDGILDYWITDVEAPPQLWLSSACTTNNWLTIQAPNSTMVRVTGQGRTWTGLVHGQSSYGANRSPEWHLGLGQVSRIDHIEVRYPNSDWQDWSDVPQVNTTLVLTP